jgi:hypothetical protein
MRKMDYMLNAMYITQGRRNWLHLASINCGKAVRTEQIDIALEKADPLFESRYLTPEDSNFAKQP